MDDLGRKISRNALPGQKDATGDDGTSAEKVGKLFEKAVIQSVNTQLFIPRNDQVEVVMVDATPKDRC